MKLLSKTIKYQLVFFALFSFVAIAILYFSIQYMVYDDVDKKLAYESERINFHILNTEEIPPSNYIIRVSPVSDTFPLLKNFTDTLIYEVYDDELIPYRDLDFTTPISRQKRYQITLRNILLDSDDLIVGLFFTISIIFILMIAGLFFVNQIISKRLWLAFFDTLAKIRRYKLEDRKAINLEASGIDEFNTLNEVIFAFTHQIEKDYIHLKEFNENVTHEMQTPLAVISNKMEQLMESPNLTEREINLVKAAYRECNKLSKMEKALSFMSKIENLEFRQMTRVNIRNIIENILDSFDEILNFKEIELKTTFHTEFYRELDPILVNVLFTNLVKNAVQHNKQGGFINIILDEQKFEIENSGEILHTNPEELFERFQKADKKSQSMGLGLAIAQKISRLYGFQLSYQYHEGKHKFSILF
ncbi:MAG: HAMP domain-containing histidine kinase [Bacteroidetes bacterium]|nr:HAMP domain-containing histidine kinase [Bacteroidota bacterium]MCB0846397.1 HAMP domain-containing histidine kinase [Bacteroidota bacterium]